MSETTGGLIHLPIEAAKRLRWYDRGDLKLIIHLHLKEKAELYEEIDKLTRLGGAVASENAENVSARRRDESVAMTLALSASAEVDRLKTMLHQAEKKLQACRGVSTRASTLDSCEQHSVSSSEKTMVLSSGDVASAAGNEHLNAVKAAQDACLEAWKSREDLESQNSQQMDRIRDLEIELARLQNLQAATMLPVYNEEMKTKVLQVKRLEDQLGEEKMKSAELEERLMSALDAAATCSEVTADLNTVTSERDVLASRILELQTRCEEYEAAAASADSLEGSLKESNSRLAAAELELLRTAQVAASLERHMSEIEKEKHLAMIRAEQAERKALDAEKSIMEKVVQRWAEAGTDRREWPEVAVGELERVEGDLKSLEISFHNLQTELKRAKEAKAESDVALARAKDRLTRAELEMKELKTTGRKREDQFHATHLATVRQAETLKEELAKVKEQLKCSLQTNKNLEAMIPVTVGSNSNEEAFGTEATNTSVAYQQNSVDGDLGMDCIYTKNVVIKFIDGWIGSRWHECELLLPALAAVLRASPDEYKHLCETVAAARSPLGTAFYTLRP